MQTRLGVTCRINRHNIIQIAQLDLNTAQRQFGISISIGTINRVDIGLLNLGYQSHDPDGHNRQDGHKDQKFDQGHTIARNLKG